MYAPYYHARHLPIFYLDEEHLVHLVWILQCVYFGPSGEALGDTGQSKKFNTTGSVRQGCVQSPRLICAVLQRTMREWRAQVGSVGFNLIDGGPNLFDLRFADDFLIFAQSRVEIGNLLGALVKTVGLRWSAFEILRREGSLRMRPNTCYKLDTRMARSIPSMERSDRMGLFVDRAEIKLWPRICCRSCWKFSSTYCHSTVRKWVQRILRWCPPGPYRIGRPHLYWTSAGTKAWDDGLMLAYPWAHPKKTKHMGHKV